MVRKKKSVETLSINVKRIEPRPETIPMLNANKDHLLKGLKRCNNVDSGTLINFAIFDLCLKVLVLIDY